jgi:SHS2 domain-containing protein
VSYRWIEHTGELEVELQARSQGGLFEAALEAMRELLSFDATPEPMQAEIELQADDRAALLADWLGELAFLAEARGLVPKRLVALELRDDGISATVAGSRGDPPHLVKAATYHRLRFEPAGGGWRARVVLDV